MTTTEKRRLRYRRWALLALFLLAFLPRVVYPVSRPLQWYTRSARFFQAIMERDWAGTLFSEHPGVTVMWLSGAALWGWYGLQSLLGLDPPKPLQTEGYAFADRVAVGVFPLALVVSLGILWGWYLLRRLFGRRVAWVGALLWALDPFYLANSKAIHLDGVLATLMILSALWMLLYLREGRVRQLTVSAVLGGLAVLTKVSALFLLPFLALCLLVVCLSSLRGQRPLFPLLRAAVDSFFCWAFIAAVVCCALWPSLWVQPRDTLEVLAQKGIVEHVGQAHSLPRFHRGAVGMGDPGVTYYLDVLLFRTTLLTLPFGLLGLFVVLVVDREWRRSALFLLAFALFFFVQMALGGRKEERYMLPVILAWDVLAAFGMVWWSGRLGGWAVCLLVVQAVVVLPLHPYYGVHYNLMLGGQREAERVLPLADFGEGLDLAGRYIAGRPDADGATVGAQFLANEMLAQHVRAPVEDISQVGDQVDYLVFGVQYTMRGPAHPRWGALWEQTYKFRQPEYVVSFGGIPYAWVYRPGIQPTIPHLVDARLGEAIRLVGYRLAYDEVAPGDALLLTLYWQAEGPVEDEVTAFVHLQGVDGRLVAQRDHPPGAAGGWESGALVEDRCEVQVPPDVPSGDYTLSVGMYDPATMERLPALEAGGRRLPEDRVVLATVRLQPAVPWYLWALSGVWLAVVVAGVVWPWVGRRP